MNDLSKFRKKEQFYRYVGDLTQICGIREYEMKSGRANGVRAFDVKNGSGLEFTVLQDRCLDISALSFNGINCSYLSKTGVTAPAYNGNGTNFSRTFYGGFLTTCGLRNVGDACEEHGECFGTHGRISNLPAEEIRASVDWVDDIPEITVSGKIRESSFFGENILLERKISCRYGDNRIRISNTIENQGFKPEVLMLLLHFNIGYPLLSPCSRFLSPFKEVIPRDAQAEAGIRDFERMQPPTKEYAEQVFYHTLRTDGENNTMVALINPEIETGLSLTFNRNQFSRFTQWKQMGEGEYVLGMEPCNCYVGGRSDARNKGFLTGIQPFEKKQFDVTVELHSGIKQLEMLENKINNLKNNIKTFDHGK
ncbi:MAG: aldose 1-epimerase family protein [Dysgonamonadaceae bacterium]|jgi:hypothetical protein|nr:aldose 1-epimerase family protein [Dysgonamonadaceae bacterium]